MVLVTSLRIIDAIILCAPAILATAVAISELFG